MAERIIIVEDGELNSLPELLLCFDRVGLESQNVPTRYDTA
jgi:hypothetical protein